jgi:DNA-binding GntR family transcriptional regulator
MNFKRATDALFDRVSHEELASQIGVSVPAIRQARLEVSAKAHRSAPRGWEKAVVELAENRIRQYHELIGTLEQHGGSGSESAK